MARFISKPANKALAAAVLSLRICFSVLACFAALGRPATGTEPLVRIGSIPLKGVEGRLDHLAYDPRSQRLFVAALENHSVEVLDLSRLRRIHRINGVSEPQGLLYVRQRNRLLVCCRGDGTCRSFDATSFKEGPWVDLGRNADNLRLDSDGQTVYIGSAGEPGNGLLSAIDITSLVPAEQGGHPSPPHSPADFLLDRPRQADPKLELPLGAHPESFQIEPASHRLLVNVPDERQIVVVQIGARSLTNIAAWPVTVGEKNFPMAIDTKSERLFVACRKPPALAVYRAGTGDLLSQTPCVGDADDMFYDQRLGRLYVIGGEGFVDVFEVSADGRRVFVIVHLATAPRARTGLFMPELELLAVAAPHTMSHPAEIELYRAKP